MEIIIEEIIQNVIVNIEENITSPTINIEETILEYKIIVEDLKIPGPRGKSVFDIAVENGFVGTEAQWLKTLVSLDSRVYNEIPSGLLNGVNNIFTSINNFIPESLSILSNGISLKRTLDYYTVGNNQIYLNFSPNAIENLFINYTKL